MIKELNTTKTEKGKKILSTPCQPIVQMEEFHKVLIRDLVDTANAHPGCIGLCANQIWELEQIPAPAIFIVPGHRRWIPCINPTIDRTWKKLTTAPEGCMSIPGFVTKKSRTRHILVSYFNEEMNLREKVPVFDIPARIFQHEMDHIQGKLIDE